MPTKIAWTDETWNPVTGCSKVSPGCDNCYAERIMRRFGHDWQSVQTHPKRLGIPQGWKRARRIFVCSMGDLFHPRVPWSFVTAVFDVMAESMWHTFQLLTKRPGRMAYFAEKVWPFTWPSNVWAGTSVESEKYLPRLDVLARVPAPVRFVSLEPLLSAVDLKPYFYHCGCGQEPCQCKGSAIHWVVCGGESGLGARPMHTDWVRAVRDQCQAAGVPLFIKQDSGRKPGQQGRIPDALWALKECPNE